MNERSRKLRNIFSLSTHLLASTKQHAYAALFIPHANDQRFFFAFNLTVHRNRRFLQKESERRKTPKSEGEKCQMCGLIGWCWLDTVSRKRCCGSGRGWRWRKCVSVTANENFQRPNTTDDDRCRHFNGIFRPSVFIFTSRKKRAVIANAFTVDRSFEKWV